MKRWFIVLLVLLILLFGLFFVMRRVDLVRFGHVGWGRCISYTVDSDMTVVQDEMIAVAGIPARVLIAHSPTEYVAGIFEGDGNTCQPLVVRRGDFIDSDETRPLWTSFDAFNHKTEDTVLLRLYPPVHSVVVYADEGELQAAKFIEEYKIFSALSTRLRKDETFGGTYYFVGPHFNEFGVAICAETDPVCLSGDSHGVTRGLFNFTPVLNVKGEWGIENIVRH